MCIRNNDNHVHVTHLTMDGGILGYFWKISKNMYFFDRDRNTQISTFNFK